MTRFWEPLLRVMGDGGMGCEGIRERLYEFIDGEIADQRLSEVMRTHLGGCEGCSSRYEFEKVFVRFIGERARRPAPVGLCERVLARLEQRDI